MAEYSYSELLSYLLIESKFKEIKTLARELGLSEKTLNRIQNGHEPGRKAKGSFNYFAKKHLGMKLADLDNNRVRISEDTNIKSVVNSTGTSVAGDSNVVGGEDYKQKYLELKEKYDILKKYVDLLENQK